MFLKNLTLFKDQNFGIKFASLSLTGASNMYKINETKLSEITNNFEAIRDNFGKWVNLYIKTDSKVIVTSRQRSFPMQDNKIQILGELSKEHSKEFQIRFMQVKRLKQGYLISAQPL